MTELSRRRVIAGGAVVLVLLVAAVLVWHPWNRVSGVVRTADQATPVVPARLAGLRTRPDVAWQLRTGSDPLPYQGQQSGTLFIDGSSDGTRRAPWAFAAVSATDGTLRWSRTTAFQFQGYTSGGVLGVSGSTLQLLDASSGKARWSVPFEPGSAASTVGDVVLVRRAEAATGITVLSATDGKQLWTRSSGHWLASTPTSQALYSLDGTDLQLLDAATGTVLASRDVGAIDAASAQILAINGARPVVLVRDSRFGRTAAFTRGSLEPVWRASLTGEPVPLPGNPGLLITRSAGDTIETYARTDPATGKQLWTTRVEGPFPNGSTATVASGSSGQLEIYGQRADGSALVEGADLATGKVLWSKKLARTVNLSVAVSDDVVYLRHDDGADVAHGQLIGLDARTGRKLWQVAGATLGLMTPAPVDHGLLVESGTGLRRLG